MNTNIMIGDLIQIVTDDCDAEDDRSCGTVLKFDTYSSNVDPAQRIKPHRHRGLDGYALNFGRHSQECIVEVLWNTGSVGWILKSRIGQVQSGI
jgi:hypothetical protein